MLLTYGQQCDEPSHGRITLYYFDLPRVIQRAPVIPHPVHKISHLHALVTITKIMCVCVRVCPKRTNVWLDFSHLLYVQAKNIVFYCEREPRNTVRYDLEKKIHVDLRRDEGRELKVTFLSSSTSHPLSRVITNINIYLNIRKKIRGRLITRMRKMHSIIKMINSKSILRSQSLLHRIERR